MAFLPRNGRRSGGIRRLISCICTPSYTRPVRYIFLSGTENVQRQENGWQWWGSVAKFPLNGNGFSMIKPLGYARLYSVSSQEKEKENDRVFEGFKHQEIEGPTVERDMSALANEVRDELKQLRKSIYDLSKGVLLLGLAHLSCGAWFHWITKSSLFSEISLQSFLAFAFPFTFAYLLTQVLKPMTFFTKLEEQGRLQMLTLALQVTKGMIALCQRLKAVAILCATAISIGLLANQWLSSGST